MKPFLYASFFSVVDNHFHSSAFITIRAEPLRFENPNCLSQCTPHNEPDMILRLVAQGDDMATRC